MKKTGKKLICGLMIAAILLLLTGCGRTELQENIGRFTDILSRLAAYYAAKVDTVASSAPAATVEPTAEPAATAAAAPTAMPMPALEEDELPWVPA